MRLLALVVLLLCAVGPADSRGRRKKKDSGGGGAGQRSGDGGAELAGLLDSVGVTREQYDKVLKICRRNMPEKDWDPRHRMPYGEMQRFIAREVVSQGPEAVHTFTTDDKGMKGLWSNGAIKAQEQDLYYQWGPTRPDWFGTPEPFPDEIRRIDARDASYERMLELWDGSEPAILTGVDYPALNWTKQWLTEQLHDHQVKIQMRVPGSHWAQTGKCDHFYQIDSLHTFTNVVAHTMALRWCYVMDEEFFFEEQGGIPNWMKEQVLNGGGTLPFFDYRIDAERDLFMQFPELARPNNLMLLWGGAYSRSLLHVDPYNWTGTNGVIFGQKYWKLYPPGEPDVVEGLYGEGHEASSYINSPHYFSPLDAFAPDIRRYPKFLEAEKHVLRAVQKPGELMLIPSGWWHMAYNPVETLAFSSQFLNLQNYRPAIYGVLSGNEVVGDCVADTGIVRKLEPEHKSWNGGREYEWTRPALSYPYNGTMAAEEMSIVLGCLRETVRAVQIPGKENLGKTSGLNWLPKADAERRVASVRRPSPSRSAARFTD